MRTPITMGRRPRSCARRTAAVWTHRHNRVQLEAYETIHAQRNEFYLRIMAEAGVPAEQRQRLTDSRRSSDRHAEAVKDRSGLG